MLTSVQLSRRCSPRVADRVTRPRPPLAARDGRSRLRAPGERANPSPSRTASRALGRFADSHNLCARAGRSGSSLPCHSRTGQQTALKSMSHSPVQETLSRPAPLVPGRSPSHAVSANAGAYRWPSGSSRSREDSRSSKAGTTPGAAGGTRQGSQRLDPAANAGAAAAGSPGNSKSAARAGARLALACAGPLGLATLMMPARVGPGPLRMWVPAHGAPSRRRPGLCQVNTSLPAVIRPDRKDGAVTSAGAGRVMAVML